MTTAKPEDVPDNPNWREARIVEISRLLDFRVPGDFEAVLLAYRDSIIQQVLTVAAYVDQRQYPLPELMSISAGQHATNMRNDMIAAIREKFPSTLGRKKLQEELEDLRIAIKTHPTPSDPVEPPDLTDMGHP